MKKALLLLMFLLLLTGCKAEYHVKITDNNDENLEVYIPNDVNRDEIIDEDMKLSYNEIFDMIRSKKLNIYYDKISEVEYSDDVYYQIKDIDNKDKYGVIFSNKFSQNDYYRSSLIKECYKDINIIKDDDAYIYRTNNKCDAFDNYKLLDEVKIVIEVDPNKDILYNNADKKEENTLTWIINRDNYTNKNISFSIDKKADISKSEKPKKENKSSKYNKIFIISGLLIVIIVITVVVKLKRKHL